MNPYIQLIQVTDYPDGKAREYREWNNNPLGKYEALSYPGKAMHLVRQHMALSYIDFIYDGAVGFLTSEYRQHMMSLYINFKNSMENQYLKSADRNFCQKAISILEAINASDNSNKGFLYFNIEMVESFFDNGLLATDEFVPLVGYFNIYKCLLEYRAKVRHTAMDKELFTIHDGGIFIPKLSQLGTPYIEMNQKSTGTYKFDNQTIKEPVDNFFHFLSCFSWPDITFSGIMGILGAYTNELDYNSISGINQKIFYNVYRSVFNWEDPFNSGPSKFSGRHHLTHFIDFILTLRVKCGKPYDKGMLVSILEGTDMRILSKLAQDGVNPINSLMENFQGFTDFITSLEAEEDEFDDEEDLDEEGGLDEDPDEGEDVAEGDPDEDAGGDEGDPEDGEAPEEEEPDDNQYETNDKIGVELEFDMSEPSIDTVIFRKEILTHISNVISNPPPKVSARDLQLLKNLKMYWLAYLSAPTILAILKVANSPVKIKITNK